MSKYFIKSISIEGFRGVNNFGNPLSIDFQTDGATSIFGENGKGKSSIFEAFLFSLLGRILRLEEYHTDIRDKKVIKNLFHPGDGIIKIEIIDDSRSSFQLEVKVNSNGDRSISSTSIADPEAFLKSLCNSLNFLDYKSFEKIMISSSEDTGKLFANLVGFGKFTEIKEKLDKISRTQNINNDFGRTTKEYSIRTNDQRITTLKGEIGTKLKEIGVSLINEYDKNEIINKIRAFTSKQYGIKINSSDKHTTVDFDLLLKTKIGSSYEEDALKLSNQKEDVEKLVFLNKSITKFTQKTVETLSKKLSYAYSQIDSPDDIVLGRLYDDAISSYDIIEDFDRNTCVLCNTHDLGNKGKTFYDHIKNKIKGYYRFKVRYDSFLTLFRSVLKSSGIIEYEQKALDDNRMFFSEIVRTNEFLTSDFFKTNKVFEIIESYKSDINHRIAVISSSINDLKVKVPPKITELVETNSVYKFVFNSVVEIGSLQSSNEYNIKYLYELENWTTFINKTKEEFEEAYNILMDEIATMIDSDTKCFFREIMGDVDIIPKLKKEHKGQKVNILLERFYSNLSDLKAAPLLSESYRNALSLSIYFAAALKSRNKGSFIIVDDITSSFDSGHQLFLLKLIKNKIAISPTNKKGKQIIFLTHDGLLKKPLSDASQQKNWTHYSLNFNKDITTLKPITSDDLKNNLINKIRINDYDKSDLRHYYESVLLEIIENLNLEVPYSLINNHEEKMLNNMLKAISVIVDMRINTKRVKKNLPLPVDSDYQYHLTFISNYLSHQASSSLASLSTPALMMFVTEIDNFKKKFQYSCSCQKNLGWVYYKSLNSPLHKGCTCKI